MIHRLFGSSTQRISGLCAISLSILFAFQTPVSHAEGKTWEQLRRESSALFMKRDFEGAMSLEKQAMKIAERSSAYDPRIIQNLGAMATMYYLQGKYAEAVPLYQRIITIHKHGPAYPLIATTYRDLGNAYKALGKDNEAKKYQDLAAAARRQ